MSLEVDLCTRRITLRKHITFFPTDSNALKKCLGSEFRPDCSQEEHSIFSHAKLEVPRNFANWCVHQHWYWIIACRAELRLSTEDRAKLKEALMKEDDTILAGCTSNLLEEAYCNIMHQCCRYQVFHLIFMQMISARSRNHSWKSPFSLFSHLWYAIALDWGMPRHFLACGDTCANCDQSRRGTNSQLQLASTQLHPWPVWINFKNQATHRQRSCGWKLHFRRRTHWTDCLDRVLPAYVRVQKPPGCKETAQQITLSRLWYLHAFCVSGGASLDSSWPYHPND